MTARREHTGLALHPPFPRVLCAVDGGEGAGAAIQQALAVAGDDSRIVFAASSQRGADAAERALAEARAAGVEASPVFVPAPHLSDAVLQLSAQHDLVVVAAHPHTRATGIAFGEDATQLVHRSRIPVLVARDRPLAAGVIAATRALPTDRHALTTATRLAARLGAHLTVVHVGTHGDERYAPELRSELANARALLGHGLDYVRESGSPPRAIVTVAEGDGAGLIVVGSDRRLGVAALASVSERVAHQASCSVLVMRDA
jgi:nucleotide-binding universal stress UspA family protein